MFQVWEWLVLFNTLLQGTRLLQRSEDTQTSGLCHADVMAELHIQITGRGETKKSKGFGAEVTSSGPLSLGEILAV